MDYQNLHKKTVFDFCNDESVLLEAMVPVPEDDKERADFISRCLSDSYANACYLESVGSVLGDARLVAEVRRQFASEFEANRGNE